MMFCVYGAYPIKIVIYTEEPTKHFLLWIQCFGCFAYIILWYTDALNTDALDISYFGTTA